MLLDQRTQKSKPDDKFMVMPEEDEDKNVVEAMEVESLGLHMMDLAAAYQQQFLFRGLNQSVRIDATCQN